MTKVSGVTGSSLIWYDVGEHGFTAIAAGATSAPLFGGLYTIGHSYNGFGVISISQANGVEDFMNKLSPNQMVAQQVSGTSQYTITNNSSGVRYYKLLARLE